MKRLVFFILFFYCSFLLKGQILGGAGVIHGEGNPALSNQNPQYESLIYIDTLTWDRYDYYGNEWRKRGFVFQGSNQNDYLSWDTLQRSWLAAPLILNLNSQVTGVLPVANGGTGATSLAGAGIVTGSGTSNYLSKWTGTTTQGNSQIFDNGTNVGVASGAPSFKLDVNGSFRTRTNSIDLTYNSGIIYHGAGYYQYYSGNSYSLFARENTDLIFGSNNAVVGKFDLNGNLGINTTSPIARVHVNHNSNLYPGVRVTNGNGSNSFDRSQIALSFQNSTSYTHSIQSRHNSSLKTGNAIDFVLWEQGVDNVSDIGTNRVLSIQGDGTVGINKTNPFYALHVVGSTYTTEQFLGLPTGSSYGTASFPSYSFEGSGNNDNGMFLATIDALGFSTAGIERMRIDANGNVGIGTGTGSISEMLQVNGDARINSLTIGRGNNNHLSNTGLGVSALANVSAVESQSGYNIGIGYAALREFVVGTNNIAIGYQSMTSADSATANVAIGALSLNVNKGEYNTGVGHSAIRRNTTGSNNTSLGYVSLTENTTGNNNTAIGGQAMQANTTGSLNVAVGQTALINSVSGSGNVALGWGAGRYALVGNNDAGSDNIYIGNTSKSSASNISNEIVIGANAVGIGANSVVLGNTSITKTALRGNVGIGTTTPSRPLVIETSTGTNELLVLNATNDLYSDIVMADNTGSIRLRNGFNGFAISTGGAPNSITASGAIQKFFLDSLGNLGLGTAAPVKKLHINGGVRITDLATDVPTRLVGADADGDLGQVTLGTGLSITSGTLNANTDLSSGFTGILPVANGGTGRSSLTADRVLVGNGTSPITISTIYYSGAAGGRIGIGVETPQQSIHTVGDAIINAHRLGIGPGNVESNVVFGNAAMLFNTTGQSNVAIGVSALQKNGTGGNNTAIGNNAMLPNLTGTNNVAIGHDAGRKTVSNDDNAAGNSNVYIGQGSDASASGVNNEIVIGGDAKGIGQNSFVIGNASTIKGRLMGDVGIGTNTPSQKLDVAGNTYVSGQYLGNAASAVGSPAFSFSGDTDNGMYRPDVNTIGLVTNGNERMRIDQNGRFTFKDVDSRSTLSFYHSSPQYGLILNRNSSSTTGYSQEYSFAVDDNKYAGLGVNGTLNSTDPTQSKITRISIFASDTTITGAFGNEALTVLTGNKNIGIGKITPSEKLDVAGNIRFSGALMPNNVAGSAGQILKSAGANTPPVWGSVELNTSSVSGVLPVANGGTGQSTLTANKVLVGNGTSEILSPTNLHWDNANSRLGIGTSNVSTASLSIGGTINTENVVAVAGTLTGGTARYGIIQYNTLKNDVTANGINYYSQLLTEDTTFTIDRIVDYYAAGTTKGAGSTINRAIKFYASNVTAGNNNYSFYSDQTSGTNNYGLYMAGLAKNYIRGELGIGTTTPSQKLHVVGSTYTTGQFLAEQSGSLNAVEYSFNGDEDTGMGRIGDNNLRFITGGSERVRVDASGNTISLGDNTGFFVGGATSIAGFRALNVTGTGRVGLNIRSSYFPNETNLKDITLSNGQGDITITSGTRSLVAVTRGFIPNTGTGIFNTFTIDPTIEQTGTANGITRGIYVDPTLTSAADWRSVEWSNNTGFGLYGSGTAKNYLAGNLGIGTTTPSRLLDVNGDASINGVRVGRGNNNISNNTALGSFTLNANTSGTQNTAIGNQALVANTSGSSNTAVGRNSLASNTTGLQNVAVGREALYLNINGNNNVAVGYGSLYSNTDKNNNTAIGFETQYYSNGVANTSVGSGSLRNNIAGSNNTAIGVNSGSKAGISGINLTNVSTSIFIGQDSKASSDSVLNEIVIGYDAVGIGSNSFVIGNSSTTKGELKGWVGIGTDNPGSKLHMVTESSSSFRVQNDYTVGQPSFIGLFSGAAGFDLRYTAQATTTGDIPASVWQFRAGGSGKNTVFSYYDESVLFIGTGNPNKRVGIGTNTPSEKLDVVGNIRSTEQFFAPDIDFPQSPGYSFESDPNTGMYNIGTDILGFATAASERMRIDASGNVGINRTNPTAKLDLVGDFKSVGNVNFNGKILVNTNALDLGSVVLNGNIDDGSIASGLYQLGRVQSNVTSLAVGIWNSSFLGENVTLSSYQNFRADAVGIPQTSSLSGHYGYYAAIGNSGNNVYSFYGVLDEGATKYNLFMSGTAKSYFGGNVGIKTQFPLRELHVEGTARITNLTTDTPTRIVGADNDGDLGAITLGSGLSLTGNTLSTTNSNATIGGSISTSQVAYGTGTNTIGGNNDFLYSSVTKSLSLAKTSPNTSDDNPSLRLINKRELENSQLSIDFVHSGGEYFSASKIKSLVVDSISSGKIKTNLSFSTYDSIALNEVLSLNYDKTITYPGIIKHGTFQATSNYTGGSLNADSSKLQLSLGTIDSPWTSRDAVAIFQKTTNITTPGLNPTVYVSARKETGNVNTRAVGLFTEAVDGYGDDGGSPNSFVEGLRSHAIVAQEEGTKGGSGYGIVTLAGTNQGIKSRYLIGIESTVANNDILRVIPDVMKKDSFIAAYVATISPNSTMADVAFTTNPYQSVKFKRGFNVAPNTTEISAFSSFDTTAVGLSLHTGKQTYAITIPNNTPIVSRDGANNAFINMMYSDNSDFLVLGTGNKATKFMYKPLDTVYEAMRIHTNGFLGIGTLSNVTQRLSVNGNIWMPSAGGTNSGILYMGDYSYMHSFSNAEFNSPTNVFLGLGAGYIHPSNTSSNSIAIGESAMSSITSGNYNIAIGYQAGDTITTGSQNIYIGNNTDASNVNTVNEVVIGNNAKGKGGATTLIKNDNIYLEPNSSSGQVFIGTGGGSTSTISMLSRTGFSKAIQATEYNNPSNNTWGKKGDVLVSNGSSPSFPAPSWYTPNTVQYYNGTTSNVTIVADSLKTGETFYSFKFTASADSLTLPNPVSTLKGKKITIVTYGGNDDLTINSTATSGNEFIFEGGEVTDFKIGHNHGHWQITLLCMQVSTTDYKWVTISQ